MRTIFSLDPSKFKLAVARNQFSAAYCTTESCQPKLWLTLANFQVQFQLCMRRQNTSLLLYFKPCWLRVTAVLAEPPLLTALQYSSSLISDPSSSLFPLSVGPCNQDSKNFMCYEAEAALFHFTSQSQLPHWRQTCSTSLLAAVIGHLMVRANISGKIPMANRATLCLSQEVTHHFCCYSL